MGRFSDLKSNNPFKHSSSSANNDMDDVPPPAGPPPGYQQHDFKGASNNDYAPPPGPPPSAQHTDYAPPPGPPPSAQHTDYAPPPGPPPGQHDWQSVPLPEDTSGYPPPPDIFTGHDRSWAHNATEQQAEEGERWCRRYPLIAPLHPTASPALGGARPTLVKPLSNTFRGTITQQSEAIWAVRTDARNNDHTITAQPPLYLAARDDPRVTGAPRSVYFEVRILKDLGRDAGVGLGFVALPYPGFRMPGWHRGSLAVHSDDGHKYVNDRWGGQNFVKPFGGKGVVGIGMTFSAPMGAAGEKGKAASSIDAEVFFTRNGKLEDRWDVNEQRDQQRDLEPVGVQGLHDLVAAVGSFEKTEYEVVMEPERWLFTDVQL